jgi:hypothetical protein
MKLICHIRHSKNLKRKYIDFYGKCQNTDNVFSCKNAQFVIPFNFSMIKSLFCKVAQNLNMFSEDGRLGAIFAWSEVFFRKKQGLVKRAEWSVRNGACGMKRVEQALA